MSWFDDVKNWFKTPTFMDIAGTGMSYLQSRETADEMRDAAEKARAWQKGMSDTAHQREVEDLYMAGLNPILSAGGHGASTPAGATAQVPDYSRAITSGVQAMTQRETAKATVDKVRAEAAQARVLAKIHQDMLNLYGSSDAVQSSVLHGMLGKLAGIPLGIGGGYGFGESAAKTVYDTVRAIMGYYKGKAHGPYKPISDPKDVTIKRGPSGRPHIDNLFKKGR